MYAPSPVVSRLLSVPAWLFEGIVRFRIALYTRRIVPSHRLSHPVISVGNLTLGGTGKTPLVIYAAKVLLELGAQPALLSRGYGRINSRTIHILDPADQSTDFSGDLGDEPALIRRRVEKIWLGISADRYRAATELLRRNADLTFILDDGFQHLKLDRDIDVLVLDSTQALSENHLFPKGSLREPLSAMSRAQVIVMNVSRGGSAPETLASVIRKFNKKAALLHCDQVIDSIVPYASWTRSLPTSSPINPDGNAFVAAAIGNPQRFLRDVEGLGIPVRGTRFYRDHHELSPQEWRACAEDARKCKADFIIVTEKDAIKIRRPPEFPLLVALQEIRLHEAIQFRNILKQLIGGRR